MPAKPKRPYLLRALFEWIVDSELTPYILAAAEGENVRVPRQYVKDGKIVLNISPTAVRDLAFRDDAVQFNGRFAGTPFAVEVPMAFVLAIYAKETGEGMMFEPESEPADKSQTVPVPESDEAVTDSKPGLQRDSERDPDSISGPKKPPSGPHLKLIK